MLIALKISKSGYGSPEQILQWDTEMVLATLEYEKFLSDYEMEFTILNKEDKQ